MTKEQKKELKRYKSALFQYKLAKNIPWLRNTLNVQLGFCYHFAEITWPADMGKYLPTLYSLRTNHVTAYWFDSGKLEPRIELLKQAIKILEEEKDE